MRMRKILSGKLLIAAIAFLGLMLVPNKAFAYGNDYMEKWNHYQAYAVGLDCVRFKFAVYSYGFWNDYYMTGDSYVYYQLKGSDEKVKILWVRGESSYNLNYTQNKEYGYVKLLPGAGDVVILSMRDGIRKQINTRDEWVQLSLRTEDDDDHRMMEFNWYPPEELDNKEFSVGIHAEVERPTLVGKDHYVRDRVIEGFVGNANMITPQLFKPYLYQVSENGTAGSGQAGIVYSTFHPTISYSTSVDPGDTIRTTDRSGHVFVMTTDTVQEDFTVDFKVYRNQAIGLTTIQHSTSLDIPPYHRIYNFDVLEEMDSTGTFTGNNELHWEIRNPNLTDIVEGDFFEIQRALKSDFSDAQQLTVVPMVRDTLGLYTFADNSREIWTGNADASEEKFLRMKTLNNYWVCTQDGYPVANINATLRFDGAYYPAIPVYYRIRRASSSIWGWDNDFSQTVTSFKHNFLAPIAETQEPYTLDENYSENHKVNFRIHIDNKLVASRPEITKEKCDFYWAINYGVETAEVNIKNNIPATSSCSFDDIEFRVLDDRYSEIHDFKHLAEGTYVYPSGCMMIVRNKDKIEATRMINSSCRIECTTNSEGDKFVANIEDIPNADAKDQLEPFVGVLKDSIIGIWEEEDPITYGRCMWDRSARLVLIRTIEETGKSEEFIIPQDSIRRQPDGSWIVTYSDVADKACLHYSYSVRVDQTNADLRMQSPKTDLLPVALTGPVVYYDDGAAITQFAATKGDARSDMKRGVQLSWQASSSAVDYYILQRKAVRHSAQ